MFLNLKIFQSLIFIYVLALGPVYREKINPLGRVNWVSVLKMDHFLAELIF